MSATPPPQQLAGTQAPSQIEFLWERYRRHFNLVVTLGLCAVAGYYLLKSYNQKQVDKHWSEFAVSTGLETAYTDQQLVQMSSMINPSVIDLLADLPKLETYLAAADQNQKPYVLLAIARRAMLNKAWDRADSALNELATQFPKHSLVENSTYPVQVREDVKKEKDAEETQPRNKKPELKPAIAGSAVSLLREQIAAAKAFVPPARFAKPEIGADNPRFKFELSGDNGSFTIALMPDQAPKTCEAFKKLATQETGPFWKGLSVDEIQRNGTGFAKHPMQLSLGFESTKEAEQSKWIKTDPSQNTVEFETNSLSHFPGAVAARVETDGKSAADRFYVVADDAAEQDGQRVVFGYIVEGLENVKKVCESAMSAQEDEAGVGVPTDRVTVTNVTQVK
jgi:cyclophilin family peptidyl-prolyl cis-trans isomerase